MLDFFFLNISINFEHFLKVVVLVTQNAKLLIPSWPGESEGMHGGGDMKKNVVLNHKFH